MTKKLNFSLILELSCKKYIMTHRNLTVNRKEQICWKNITIHSERNNKNKTLPNANEVRLEITTSAWFPRG
jgi:hypothetical protein